MKFETPDEALHSLVGLLRGVWMDGVVNDDEIQLLLDWTSSHRHLESEAPFDQFLPELDKVLEDKVFEHGELDELFWMIEGYKMTSDVFLGSESDATKLEGLLRAVVADGEVSVSELKGIHDWFSFQKSSDGVTPEFQEVSDLLDEAMQQQEVSEETLANLLNVFRGLLARFDAK